MKKYDDPNKVKNFHELHYRSSTFVLPNAWDVISAKMFEESGFKAIGTTSAGIAASLGYTDGQNMPLNQMIETIERIAKSVNVPVTADIEAGYGQTVNEVLETVKKVIEAGAVGINLEDGTGNSIHPIYDISLQKEKIAAIRKMSDSINASLFINARTDMYWLNIGDPSLRFHETVKRAESYQEAGADCIFVPGLSDQKIIQCLRNAISCPINLLVNVETPSLMKLSEIGIERLSCGSAPFRTTVTLLKEISEEIINQGTIHKITNNVLSYGEIAEFMQKPK
ncbi:isocitrate lyase/PEP mutase family protein [Alteribacillus bidgolensis]|uniref:2-Methylisocitrate lyase, PEP mutase family n=1 Tax=Alteribacillus bidgolensis TaxID=930129 RepID=A0A1G8QPM8_9BACI|nr:isocitrate lyase/phosphoenolpyruvate mutase family protein [Alteribacillus bidgolensis]SDJ06611.1 2-Methylisocitrate lyase, PEP mutase family [Alteribacillus bidgolensis]